MSVLVTRVSLLFSRTPCLFPVDEMKTHRSTLLLPLAALPNLLRLQASQAGRVAVQTGSCAVVPLHMLVKAEPEGEYQMYTVNPMRQDWVPGTVVKLRG